MVPDPEESPSPEATEQTALLANEIRKHALVYDRFSAPQKRLILALVSGCGLVPLFVSGVFTVSIPTIARDFDSTTDVISLSVSLSVLGAACGSMLAASYSSYYGRRPIYLTSLPIFITGSFGVLFSRSIPELMAFRFLQTFGASPGMAIGGATISDIYPLEQRGFAMGVFLAAVLIGPALAPLAGGLAAQYASWRAMQGILAFAGILGLLAIFVAFPETSHPGTRGKDKAGTRGFVFINPLKVLWIMRSPNLMLVSLAGTAILLSDFVLFVPLAETIGNRYNIHNQALIGACFAPVGIGNMIGAPLAGRLSDKAVVKWRAARGSWYPEDRLRATLFGAAVLVPVSVILAGVFIQFVDGPIGLTLVLICMFFNGVGVDVVLTPGSAYCVDILHERSAEAMAANMGVRSLIIGIISAGIFPAIHSIGIALTYAITGIIAWLGLLMLLATIRYGDRMRAWIDVGYSTPTTN